VADSRFEVSRLGTAIMLHTPDGDYTLTPRELSSLVSDLCAESRCAEGIEPHSGEPFDPFEQ